jgi:hypothetical protein
VGGGFEGSVRVPLECTFFFVASKPLKCITKARVGLEAGASVRGANSEHQAIDKISFQTR